MKTLIDLYKIENEKGFYDVKVNGFPLWYIFRHTYRNKWTGQDELIKNISNSTWKNLSGAISHSFKSLIDLLIILFGNAKKENAFFPISRLQKVNGQYLDKFKC